MSEVMLFTRRQDTTIRVIQINELDNDWPSINLIECMLWFQTQIAEIPSQYLADAKVEFGVDEGRNEPLATITIRYTRPENDDEMQARARMHQEIDNAREEHDLRLLRKLLERYQHKL